MNLLVLILKKANLMNEICKELTEEGVHGGTILDGIGKGGKQCPQLISSSDMADSSRLSPARSSPFRKIFLFFISVPHMSSTWHLRGAVMIWLPHASAKCTCSPPRIFPGGDHCLPHYIHFA